MNLCISNNKFLNYNKKKHKENNIDFLFQGKQIINHTKHGETAYN